MKNSVFFKQMVFFFDTGVTATTHDPTTTGRSKIFSQPFEEELEREEGKNEGCKIFQNLSVPRCLIEVRRRGFKSLN